MLVISRKSNEAFIIGENIVVRVLEVKNGKARIGIEAPADVSIHRQEVWVRIHSESESENNSENLAE